jgi:hypothetical protein
MDSEQTWQQQRALDLEEAQNVFKTMKRVLEVGEAHTNFKSKQSLIKESLREIKRKFGDDEYDWPPEIDNLVYPLRQTLKKAKRYVLSHACELFAIVILTLTQRFRRKA